MTTNIPSKPLRTMRRFQHVDLVEEMWDTEGGPPLRMEVYRNKAGDYVDTRHGRKKKRPGAIVRAIRRRGIAPELARPENNVCSVGKGADGLYYGWSHRAMIGFGLGDRVFEAEYAGPDGDMTLFVQHGRRVIQTDADAREAAVAFADYVS